MDTIVPQLKRHAGIVVQVVLICTAGLFLSINSDRQLVDYDEATYAKVVVDTMHTGQIVDLYRGDKPWFEKPPLYLWATMGSVKLFGENEFAFRYPSILAAVLCCWLVYLILVTLTGDLYAAASGFLILLFTDVFLFYGREMRLDSAVVASILVIMGIMIMGILKF